MAALTNIVSVLPSALLLIPVVVVLLLVLLVGIAYALVIGKMTVISVSELRRPKKRRGGSRSRGNGRREGDEAGVAFASVKALARWIIKRSSENHRGFGTWIVDSEASHHLCGDRMAFDSLKWLPKPTTVYLGDGSRVFATGSGEVRIDHSDSSITIQALYIPNLTYNLFSVDCLSTKSEVRFRNGSCFIESEHSTQEQLASLQD